MLTWPVPFTRGRERPVMALLCWCPCLDLARTTLFCIALPQACLPCGQLMSHRQSAVVRPVLWLLLSSFAPAKSVTLHSSTGTLTGRSDIAGLRGRLGNAAKFHACQGMHVFRFVCMHVHGLYLHVCLWPGLRALYHLVVSLQLRIGDTPAAGHANCSIMQRWCPSSEFLVTLAFPSRELSFAVFPWPINSLPLSHL